MRFSTLLLSMFVDLDEDAGADERILAAATEQALEAAANGFNIFSTEHHFRGPWHSSPLEFGAFLAPQLPEDVHLGYAVLSAPLHHPVRLAESMNLLDHLMRGRVVYGLGGGFPGLEPAGLGVPAGEHASGAASAAALDVLERLWDFRAGDPEYTFRTPAHAGSISKPIRPGPYRKERPLVISTGRREEVLLRAAREGRPAFLGTFGDWSFLLAQIAVYRDALAAAGHPEEVVERCLDWCTYDWLSVVVAPTDALAHAAYEVARRERLERRHAFAARSATAPVGPARTDAPGDPTAAAFLAGRDMDDAVVGSPATVARRVQELADVGINHLLVRFLGEYDGDTRQVNETSMRLFAREVMPRFAGVRPRLLAA